MIENKIKVFSNILLLLGIFIGIFLGVLYMTMGYIISGIVYMISIPIGTLFVYLILQGYSAIIESVKNISNNTKRPLSNFEQNNREE